MKVFARGIASLVNAGFYDFETGVRVVTVNRDHRRCAIGKVVLK